MARKDILKGLLNPEGAAPAPAQVAVVPRSSKGAIGAVSRSIADLKARSVIEIDPHLIDAGGVVDRLDTDSAEDAELARSIAEYGQQVPILIRPHPTQDGRYQIVYGRRRVLALRDLGQPVKALIRDLDDQELVIAQGQENTARRDLSFIEKVNFARQMEAAGYSRKVICDALSVDKTLISRMISIADRIPTAVIEAIGSAHGIGRDRWLDLAGLIETAGEDLDMMLAIIAVAPESRAESRFDILHRHLSKGSATKAPSPADKPVLPRPLQGASGRIGEARLTRDAAVLRLDRAATDGFEEWLMDELPRLHAEWQARRKGN
jgi:ParB family chromosome partitioning protein